MKRKYTFAEKVGIGVAVILGFPLVLTFLIFLITILLVFLFHIALALDIVDK